MSCFGILCADHDNANRFPEGAHLPTEVDPVGSRCIDVKQGHIKTSFSHNCKSFFRSTGLLDRKAAAPQRGVKYSV
jgi:hypothetical protein